MYYPSYCEDEFLNCLSNEPIVLVKKKIIDLGLFSIIVVFSDIDPNVKRDFTSLVINDFVAMKYFSNSI